MAAPPLVLNDEQLIELFQAASGKDADRHADELFQRYTQKVALWCWRFTNDRETARDLAQEVLMKAYQHLRTFRKDAKFSTWLYSISRNHCLNHVRGGSRGLETSGEFLEETLVDTRSWDTAAELERRALADTVRTLVVQNLDETETQVMMLHYAEEVPLPVVTRLLNLTNASGAKAFVVSGKRKLHAAFRRVHAQQARKPVVKPETT